MQDPYGRKYQLDNYTDNALKEKKNPQIKK